METTSKDFQKDVIEASKKIPVLVDFWAVWCQPCLLLGPVLEKLAKEAAGRWRLVKVNTDEQQQLAMEYQIRSIPAVKLFYEGKPIAEFIGALPEVEVRRWLETNLPSESKKFLETAKAKLQSGDRSTGRKFLEQVLKLDSGNVEARVLLAELFIPAEIDKAAELLQEMDAAPPFFERIEAIRTLQRLAHLEEVAGEPEADWNLYRRGITAFTQGKYDEALESWIELVSRNRRLDDDGARKACVALFTLLGNEHDLVKKYHRGFTSALY